MNEPKSADDAFAIPYPVWIILDRRTVTPGAPEAVTKLKKGSGYFCNRFCGIEYVMIFSDQDLANRFVRENKERQALLGGIDTPQQLMNFTHDMERAGETHVGFDPRADGSVVRMLTIAELRKTVSSDLEQEPPNG